MNKQEILARLPQILPDWYRKNARPLPWRRDREPYHVWLSEIMLQQTRVEAVKGYYERFLQRLPTIRDLAEAEPDTLTKLWEGLGYYSRVRNLQAAARQIQTLHGGVFPDSYEKIRALQGIGDYTAGAIASICFELPTPAVDGNVLRIISRLMLDERDVLLPQVRKDVAASLAPVYPEGQCGVFTQSLMELGAMVCLPNGAPRCESCPAASVCMARQTGAWQRLPVKGKKAPRQVRELTVFVLRCDGKTAVRKRPHTGLLAGLWEFPNVEGKLSAEQALETARAWGTGPRDLEMVLERQHIFTHVVWQMRCFYIRCAKTPEGFTWASEDELDERIALPTAFRMFRQAAQTEETNSES